ncbi:MAG TPA: hypothetical protein VGG75_37060 [Trebonia sp.]
MTQVPRGPRAHVKPPGNHPLTGTVTTAIGTRRPDDRTRRHIDHVDGGAAAVGHGVLGYTAGSTEPDDAARDDAEPAEDGPGTADAGPTAKAVTATQAALAAISTR